MLYAYEHKITVCDLMGNSLIWQNRNDHKLRIGIDPWLGYCMDHRLPQSMIVHLSNRGITFLYQVKIDRFATSSVQSWISAEYLDLPQGDISSWNKFAMNLTKNHIFLTHEEDTVIWVKNLASGSYNPRIGYHAPCFGEDLPAP